MFLDCINHIDMLSCTQLIRQVWKEIGFRYGGNFILHSFSTTCGSSNEAALKAASAFSDDYH